MQLFYGSFSINDFLNHQRKHIDHLWVCVCFVYTMYRCKFTSANGWAFEESTWYSKFWDTCVNLVLIMTECFFVSKKKKPPGKKCSPSSQIPKRYWFFLLCLYAAQINFDTKKKNWWKMIWWRKKCSAILMLSKEESFTKNVQEKNGWNQFKWEDMPIWNQRRFTKKIEK